MTPTPEKRTRLIDLRGKRFGRWCVIDRGSNTKHGFPKWICQCECGRKKEINGSDLRLGKSNGCAFCGNKKYRSQNEKINYFMTKVMRMESGCWEWITENPRNYPTTNVTGDKEHMHRASWILFRGPIPPELWVLHKCDNRMCANPDHLFLGTSKDNIDDMVKKGRQSRGAAHSLHMISAWVKRRSILNYHDPQE